MEPPKITTGSEHYDTHRERSREASAVIAGICFAVMAVAGVLYVLATQSADAMTCASAWVR